MELLPTEILVENLTPPAADLEAMESSMEQGKDSDQDQDESDMATLLSFVIDNIDGSDRLLVFHSALEKKV